MCAVARDAVLAGSDGNGLMAITFAEHCIAVGDASASVTCVQRHPGGAVVGYRDGRVCVYKYYNYGLGLLLTSTHHQAGSVTCLFAQGDLLAAGCSDGKVYVWNVRSIPEAVCTVSVGRSAVTCICRSDRPGSLSYVLN
jgi:WD40 repeat protein